MGTSPIIYFAEKSPSVKSSLSKTLRRKVKPITKCSNLKAAIKLNSTPKHQEYCVSSGKTCKLQLTINKTITTENAHKRKVSHVPSVSINIESTKAHRHSQKFIASGRNSRLVSRPITTFKINESPFARHERITTIREEAESPQRKIFESDFAAYSKLATFSSKTMGEKLIDLEIS